MSERTSDAAGLTHDELSATVEADIANYTIGFLKLGIDSSGQNAESAGSGTLVKIGPYPGILTAAHVLEALPRDGPIGLVAFNRSATFQRDTIRGRWDAVAIRVPENGPDGPDIGFMSLPEFNVRNLSATHSFLNLKPPAALDEPAREGWNLFAGVVGEWTTELEPVQPANLSRPPMRRKNFRLLLAGGPVSPLRNEYGFDLFDLKPSLSRPPSDYGGVSGGGVWRFYLDAVGDDRHVVRERRLIGVPFYQLSVDDDPLHLVCHGPLSIYERLTKAVLSKV
ncbi:MAG: hypothetical protein ACREC3_05150 [Methyloceanibacter sp.]